MRQSRRVPETERPRSLPGHAADPGATGLHYVAERRDMIRYSEFFPPEEGLANRQCRRAGKAMCKTTTARLKCSGMRWDADNADPGAAGLAGLEQSDQWKLYWQTRLKPTG